MAPGKVWLSMVLAAVAALPAGALAQTPGLPPASTNPTTAPISGVPALSAILNDQATPSALREEAARRLASFHSPESRHALVNALAGLGNPEAQLAACRALAAEPDEDASLVDPLFALLPTANRPLTRVELDLADAAGAALAGFQNRPDVLTRLSGLATNPRAPDAVRIAAIDALGHMPDKQAAETLVGIAVSESESDRVRPAAFDALGNLTGLTGNDREPARWRAWWDANRAKSPVDFRDDILSGRAQRLDQLQQRHRTLSDEATRELKAQYRAAAPATREQMLMRLLNSPAPELRSLGVMNMLDDKAVDGRVPEAASARLRQMIGDSDAEVRLNAANAVMALNDKEAMEPLLAQLRIERNPQVRAALARALGQIGDIRAAPALIVLLNDDFVIVAQAAADAIAALGQKLHESDPATAARAAAALRPLLARPGRSEALRESAAEAVAELRERSMLDDLQKLLNRNESLGIHRAAIKGIGLLGITETAGLVVPFLSDPERGVQLETIKALGNLRAIEASDSLAQLSNNADPSVAAAAWTALAGMLPLLSDPQLLSLEQTFDQRKQWDQKVAVLEQEAKNLQKQNNADELADKLQLIGRAQMEEKQFARAADNFGLALDLKLKQPEPAAGVILRLVTDRMNALLRARSYPQAIDFAKRQIARDPSLRDDIGREIKNEVERLGGDDQRDPGQLEQALSLSSQARAMTPPLSQRYLDMLSDLEKGMHNRLPPKP